MTYKSTLGKRDHERVEAALPHVLELGENPLHTSTCSHVRRGQQFLLITDRRLIGLSLDGKIKLEISRGDITGHHANEWATLIVRTADGTQKIGTVTKDLDTILQLLDGASSHRDKTAAGETALKEPPPPPSSDPSGAASSTAVTTADDSVPPVTAASPSLPDQLSQLAALHAQGALSDAEFMAAKGAVLGRRDTAPLPAPAEPNDPAAAPTHRRRKKVTEVERTCTRDGCTWFVPLELTKVRKPMRKSLGLVEFGEVMLGMGGAGSQQLTREQAAWARAQAARQCPECGSQAFTERVVRH